MMLCSISFIDAVSGLAGWALAVSPTGADYTQQVTAFQPEFEDLNFA